MVKKQEWMVELFVQEHPVVEKEEERCSVVSETGMIEEEELPYVPFAVEQK